MKWTVHTPRGPRDATPEEVQRHARDERDAALIRRMCDAYYRERDPYVRRVILDKLCGEVP